MKSTLRFFFDNCVPNRLAVAINILDRANEIRHLQRKFLPNTKDVDWIKQLATEGGWIIISSDLMFRSAAEKAALKDAGMPVFFLKSGWSNLLLWEQAAKLLHWWPKLVERAGRAKQGEYFVVPLTGAKIEVVRLL